MLKLLERLRLLKDKSNESVVIVVKMGTCFSSAKMVYLTMAEKMITQMPVIFVCIAC
jgi:hypothetical protein